MNDDSESEVRPTKTDEEAPTAEPVVTDEQEKLLDACRTEKAELYDRLLRKQAEFENFRKRVDKEKKESGNVVRAAVIREFLPVLDACERALKSLSDTDVPLSAGDPFRSGVELIYRQFVEVLGKFNVVPIPSVGHAFDPNLHHAIMRDDTTEFPENQILEELLKGYTFETRLLRPAQVRVAVAPLQRKPEQEG